jgi:hypothetical protein
MDRDAMTALPEEAGDALRAACEHKRPYNFVTRP